VQSRSRQERSSSVKARKRTESAESSPVMDVIISSGCALRQPGDHRHCAATSRSHWRQGWFKPRSLTRIRPCGAAISQRVARAASTFQRRGLCRTGVILPELGALHKVH
jgi:hypothetical protein